VIPEFGQLALALALCLALVQAALPLLGAACGRADWMAFARPAAAGQFVFVAVSFAALEYALLTDDFSVGFVALHSNSALPAFYKATAAWGGHEGSLLLWITVLAVWTMAVAAFSRSQPQEFISRVLGVLGIVSVGMIAFALFTSNPFARLVPAAADGNDLNPLLQDPGMIFHPPTLYLGYVGVSVPFAFAVAALLTGRLDKDWARWTRPWTVVAWVFLTAGITLGSWWAYYELGWGGWWFWDPVENSSFMPWLMATALLHSLAVTERRGIFKSWTVLLAIAAFSLSLLGTFLTRSPVMVSVHAFASDPARGLFILGLLGVFTGGALLLYALRARAFEAEGGFKLVSREAFLLGNNILLVIATIAVLFGTLYPLFIDALGLGKISVGPPYFNVMFLLPILPLAVLLGVGMHTAWRSMPPEGLLRRLRIPAALAVGGGVVIPFVFFDVPSVLTVLALSIALWVCASSLLDPLRRTLHRSGAPLTRGQVGMCLAHFGVGVFMLGATIASAYNLELDRSARPGERFEAGGFEFVFRGMRQIEGPNFVADEGDFELRKNGELVSALTPQIRVYQVQQSPMTEAAIDTNLLRDVFLALGEPLGDNAWSLRVQVKPMIACLWLGAALMALGGLVAVTDRRYRVPVRETRPAVESPRKPAIGAA
jgi:cytochrome c-type biogenesis protein CcmF